MKKVLLFLLISVLFIPRVFAENLYTVKVNDIYGNAEPDNSTIDAIMILSMREEIVSSCNESGCFCANKNGKVLFTFHPDSAEIEISDNVTASDNIIYYFTEEDISYLESNHSILVNYDGVEFIIACDSICVKSVALVDKSDNTIENSRPTFNGLKGNFDVTFLKQNDFIKYKVVITNATDKDYEIDDKVSPGKHMTYEYSYEGNDKIAHKNSDTVVYITIRYDNPIPEESYSENGTFVETEDLLINLGIDIENPKTADASSIVLFALILMLIGSIGLYKYTHRKEFLGALAITVLLIPIGLYALEKIQISINAKITVVSPSKQATLKYAYRTAVKESELNNYDLIPNYFGDGNSCLADTFIYNNVRYKDCGVYSKPEIHIVGEIVTLKRIKYLRPYNNCSDSDLGNNILECDKPFEYYYNQLQYFDINSPGTYHSNSIICESINCGIVMPDNDIIIEALAVSS